MSREMMWMMGGVLGLLVVASIAGWMMARRAGPDKTDGVANFNERTRSWWVMVGIFALTLYLGHWTTVVLFFFLSFLALREFITLNETRGCDHKVLFWCFFVLLPFQYFLVGIHWYGMASIFIPVHNHPIAARMVVGDACSIGVGGLGWRICFSSLFGRSFVSMEFKPCAVP